MSARDNLDIKNVPVKTDPKVPSIDIKARQQNRISDLDDYGSFDENPQQTPPVETPKLAFYGFKRKKPLSIYFFYMLYLLLAK